MDHLATTGLEPAGLVVDAVVVAVVFVVVVDAGASARGCDTTDLSAELP
jgi:hypothetical protein